MGFLGGFTGGFTRKAARAACAPVIFVRQGGMKAYMERMYRIEVTDSYRLARLEQSVRADMTRRDPRLANGTLKLADSTGRTISSATALDRVIASAAPGVPPVLVYSVDTSIAPAPPVAIPPLASPQQIVAREPTSNASQLEMLRRDVATQLGARLGSGTLPTREAVHNAAIEVLSTQRRKLAALTSAPVRTSNSIAADLAVSVREVNPAVLTSSNATRAIAAAVEKSHAWRVFAPAAASACAPDDNGPLFDLEPAPALVAASLGTTVVQLPIARVSSSAPVCPVVHTIAPLGAEVDVLARIGFRAHTAADYTVELVGEQITACGSCQAIGHRRCGRRCRRNLKRLEEKRAFEKATAPAPVPAKVGGNVTFEPLGAPISADIQFEPLGSSVEPEPLGADIQFVPLGADIQFVPLGTNVQTAPIDCGTCDKGKKKKQQQQQAPVAAPLDVAKAQPARVMAQVPAGYGVALRDGSVSTTLGTTPVEVRGGPRHIELVNPEGKRRVATEEPVLFMPGQLMVVRVERDNGGALSWSCHAAEHVGAQLVSALPSAAAPVPAGHMLLVHSDGTTAVAPAAGWARASGTEHEARTTDGRSYFFDPTRRFVADADNRMHPVLAVVPHATVSDATVVLLPPMKAPRSD